VSAFINISKLEELRLLKIEQVWESIYTLLIVCVKLWLEVVFKELRYNYGFVVIQRVAFRLDSVRYDIKSLSEIMWDSI
jgi:hypothetical protein